MKLSRRQFIGFALAAAGAGTAANDLLALADQVTSPDHSSLRHLNQQPGPLDDDVTATLMAMVDAFVEDNGDIGHYRAYFTWRAENRRAYRSAYQLCSAGLNGAARRLTGLPYVECDRAIRREILQHGLDMPTDRSFLFDPRVRVGDWAAMTTEDRLWLQINRYVTSEMIDVFFRTNAWIMLGYEGWPGQPRGLERYTEPLERQASSTGSYPSDLT
jgi:hypothetical protein